MEPRCESRRSCAACARAASRRSGVVLGTVLVLVGLGLVMVYSSSAVLAQQKMGDSRYFLVRDLVWVLLGLVGWR
jgi:cell division protein FtsW